ncbi:MAG: hypothetical protein J6L89_08485 [Clostridia bacterium]|nr:hypothetical protein [Clostridia bacterium]
MARIISFIMSVLFTADLFFVGLFPDRQLIITQTDTPAKYYINGVSEYLRFGVDSDGNLFEPDEDVKVIIECLDEALNGTITKVSVTSEQTNFKKRGYFTFNSALPYNTFTFSSDKNGIFTVEIELPDKTEYSFNVGIFPKNEQAEENFYYGIQPYITRAYTWGDGFKLPHHTAEESVDKILDAAEYLGVNLVREDSVGWGAMQTEPYGDVNFSVQDYLVSKVNERKMKYNWLLGYNAGKWSAADKYKENYDESIGWTYPPDENIWADFAEKIAAHYADNTDILWEIWNEPNWFFFAGSAEEYFSLLENTAKIFKNANPSAYVYSGGLAVPEKESNLIFYKKSAELINKNLLDNFGYHNHDGLDNYFDYMDRILALTESAGLTDGGFNSESGVGGANAETIACKALYTRSTDAKGFVSFAFRKTVTPENDINDFAFFNEYLQPDEAVLSYATVIRFLGNADFVKNISNEKNLVIDEYTSDGKKVLVYYSLGDKTKITAPEGDYNAFDMYGNEMKTGRKLKVTNSPVYIVYN